MKHFLSLLILFTTPVFSANAQHLSMDFPLEIPASRSSSWEQTIDLAGLSIQDFAAISVVVEAKGLGRNSVQCRLGTVDGWQEMPPFGEESVEGRYVSELIFVPAEAARKLTFKFQLKHEVDDENLRVRVHVFSPSGGVGSDIQPAPSLETAQNMLCSCPQPGFVPRATWGGAFGLNGNIYTPPAVYTTVTHLIVHHSAGTNTSNNWSGVVAAIFDYHVNTNGWSDLGYNWLIAPNGQLFEGRGGGDNVRGSHMCGYNNNTMAVCALGNYVNVPFPTAGMETMKKLLAWKSCKEDIAPIGNGPINSHTGLMQNISGHRDGCAPGYTACPGGMLYGQLAALRQGVQGYAETACQSVGFDQITGTFSLSLSPNPVSDQLQVQFPAFNADIQLRVLDAFGRQVVAETLGAGEGSVLLGLRHLMPGVYFISAESVGWAGGGRFLKL